MKIIKRICIIMIILLSVLAGVMGYAIIRYVIISHQTEESFDELRSMTDSYGEDESEEDASKELEEKYRKLKEMNPDYVGWLKVYGTDIDYPVVQSDADEGDEFYLDHGFDREYSVYGVPFLDAACDVESNNNLIIYGHRMTEKSMFHDLAEYADESFWEEHKTLSFSTENAERIYEVVAVFRYDTDNDSFRFRQYTDMDQQEYAEFMENVHERELYDTGTEAVYGDRLITLSTCDYYYYNGRIVLIAREVK